MLKQRGNVTRKQAVAVGWGSGTTFCSDWCRKRVIVENLEPLQCHGSHLDVTQMLLSTLPATRKI